MTVRPATAADIPAVLALWAGARSAAASTPDTADGVDRLLRVAPGSLLVAEEEGTLVGSLIATWDGWRGGMYRLAVADPYRHGGIGRALVARGEAALAAQGCRRISVLAGGDEDDATGFWQATGYSLDPEIARFSKNLPG